jgi:hypothetical protein
LNPRPSCLAPALIRVRLIPVQTAAEIEEYCRDPESSGCDLEMIDQLMAEAAKMKKVSPDKPIRWSKEIDDAVFKCD